VRPIPSRSRQTRSGEAWPASNHSTVRDAQLVATFIVSMLAIAAILVVLNPALGLTQWPIWTQHLWT
jgi:hypothetical protein